MGKFYCEYCGTSASSVKLLTAHSCTRHPEGYCQGFHKLYEGEEKSTYTCKYCGMAASTIRQLTAQHCPRHPEGPDKGRHAPEL